MAKKTDLDDLDNWGDFDNEFGDIEFDDNTQEIPRNKREAIVKTVKDARKGFTSNITENKLKTIGKLARNSLPTSLSNEANEVASIFNSVKDEVNEGIKEFKKNSRSSLRAIENVLPNGKIKDLVTKLKNKFGEDEENKGPSKEQIEAEMISGSINEALGIMQQQQQATEMIRQTIESKRAATTNNLLSHIYAETKFTRVFHAETTNKFYRKSLELQYKSLFVQKETLELQKAAFNSFQKQLEAVILNTGLPDIIKNRNSELLVKDLKSRVRADMINSMYKSFTPYENLKKNMLNQVKNFRQGLTSGFEMLDFGIENYAQMKEMNEMMGISGAYSVGGTLADFANERLGRFIGNKIGKTKFGKNMVYNTKNAFADPASFFKSMRNKKGVGGMFGQIGGMFGSPGMNNPEYLKRDLDLATPFDGRAHDSLVKVIPGLLSKILGEIKSIRTKVNPRGGPSGGDELIWDTTNDSFISKKGMQTKLGKEMSNAINDRVKPVVASILELYRNVGAPITGKAADAFSAAIIKYMLLRNTGMSANVLLSSEFLNTITDKKSANTIKSATQKLLRQCKEDPYILDNLNGYLKALKESMPSMSNRFMDIHKQGNGDILTDIGVASRAHDGGLLHSSSGSENFLLSNLDLKMKGVKSASFRNIDKLKEQTIANSQKLYNTVKNKVSSSFGSVKTFVGNQYNQTKDFINKVDKDTAVNFVMTNKAKLEDFISDDVSPFVKRNVEKVHKQIKNDYKKAVKQANEYLDKHPKAKEVRNMVDELKEETKEYVKELHSNTIDKEKLKIHHRNIKQIRENIVNYIKGKKQAGSERIKRMTSNDNLVKSAFRSLRKLDRKLVTNTARTPGEVLTTASRATSFTGDVLHKVNSANDIGYEGDDAIDVDYEEAKAEYMNSEEYRDGTAPTFPGWLKTMKYRTKGKKKSRLVKNAFKKMREWDRVIAGKMMKGIFKTPGAIFKVGKTGFGLAAKALGGTANVMLDMMPLGLGNVIKAPFMLMNKTLELAGLKEKKDNDKKERSGSWLSRLNIFKKDKEVKEKKGFLSRITTAMKENKGLTTLALLGGISGLLKVMGLSLTDVVDGVKKVGSILTKGFSFIINIISSAFGFVGKGIDKVKNFFGFGDKKEDGSEDDTGESIGRKVGAITGAGVGAFAAGKAMKFAKIPGGDLVSFTGKVLMSPGTIIVKGLWSLAKKLFTWGSANLIPDFAKNLFQGKNGEKTAKKLDKVIPTKEKLSRSFKEVEEKVVKKMGKKAAVKGVAKIGARIAATLSGVGTIVGLGLLAWDLAWIIKYMFIDGMSLKGAICKQYFGADMVSDEDADAQMSASSEDTEAGHISLSTTQLPNKTGTSSGIVSSVKQAYHTYSTSRSMGNSIGKSLSLAADQYSGARSDTAEKGPYGYSGKPFKTVTAEDIAKLKVDSPGVNKSPFITPNKQSSAGGQPANIEGLRPDIKNRLYAFAEDYYKWTGKKLQVNSAYRSFDQQRALWEREAKVKWTGDKDKDIKAMLAAGGKCYGHGGNVAYPQKTSAHVRGEAIDLNVSAMPNQSSIGTASPTPWLDNMLAKHGLRRNLTAFNGTNGWQERWHISAAGAPTPANETPPEPKGLTRQESLVVKEEIAANDPTSNRSLPDHVGLYDDISTAGPSSSSSSGTYGGFKPSTASYSDSTTSVSRSSSGMSDGLNELLKSQLKIQTNTRDLIKEIRDYLLTGKTPDGVTPPPTETGMQNVDTTSSTLPEPKIDLRRKYATL